MFQPSIFLLHVLLYCITIRSNISRALSRSWYFEGKISYGLSHSWQGLLTEHMLRSSSIINHTYLKVCSPRLANVYIWRSKENVWSIFIFTYMISHLTGPVIRRTHKNFVWIDLLGVGWGSYTTIENPSYFFMTLSCTEAIQRFISHFNQYSLVDPPWGNIPCWIWQGVSHWFRKLRRRVWHHRHFGNWISWK